MKSLFLILVLFCTINAREVSPIFKIYGLSYEMRFGEVDAYKEYNKKELKKFFNTQKSKKRFEEWEFTYPNSVAIFNITEENHIILLNLLKEEVKKIRKYHGMTLPLNEEFYTPWYRDEGLKYY